MLGRPDDHEDTTRVVKGRRIYDEAVREAADRVCGKRLKAALPHLVDSMERHGHFALDPEVRDRLLAASAATLDRLLKPIRPTAGSRRRRRRRQSMGKRIPVRTYNDWNGPPPGFLEIDLVLHCGGPLSGSFIHNETLIKYCVDRGIEFTRSRAYRSNDQAWIEQKNGSVVRRFVGHDRYSGQVAGQTMAHLYGALRLYVNFFQPSFKLIDKTRDGATTVKRYSPPTTPCDRLIQHDATSDEMRAALIQYRARLDPVLLLHTIRDPVLLLHTIRETQSALVAATAPEVRETPQGESLSKFLAKLPRLWRQGEVRPTHAARVRGPRHRRTRKDPFEGVWGEVLVWLQAEPDATGKALMARLQAEHPDRYSEAQLRTMQRRVKEWHGIMPQKLVYATANETFAELDGLPEGLLRKSTLGKRILQKAGLGTTMNRLTEAKRARGCRQKSLLQIITARSWQMARYDAALLA